MRALAAPLSGVTKTALGRKGPALAGLLAEWEAIVGAEVARVATPLRLVRGRDQAGAVLELQVDSAAAVAIQHLEPRIVERINTQLGHAAVARLKLRQTRIGGESQAPPPPAPPSPAGRQALADALRGIDDESLRGALERLGHAMLGAQARRERRNP